MTPKKRLLSKLVDTALRGGPRAAPARRGARGAAAPRELILPRFRRSVSASAALPPEENIGNSLVEGLRLTKNMASSNLPRVALPDPPVRAFAAHPSATCGASLTLSCRRA
jgi:hypothetical protein